MNSLVPSRDAYWLCPRSGYNAQNIYAGFRYDFELTVFPSAAPLIITADQVYRLWVNGCYVCRGPLRGHQSHWFFDVPDILPYLKIGKNWISVEIHNPGIKKIILVRDNIKVRRDESGIITMGVLDFLLEPNSLEM